MSYFYGPVPSRRLGFSLGVDIIPKKTCSFNCVYCQVGKTTSLTLRRRSYVNKKKFEKELKAIIASSPRIDYITIAGSGEPTLHKGLDKIIDSIKRVTHNAYKVCVITNSSLLCDSQVRKELRNADLIIPSLDAATKKTFIAIDRPHKRVSYEKILEGLVSLRKEFNGKLWLEIMVLAGFNDTIREARAFREVIASIKPDKVQLNLPVRPAGAKIKLPSFKKLLMLKKIIGPKTEIVSSFYKETQKKFSQSVRGDIIKILSIRPSRTQDLLHCLGVSSSDLAQVLREMRAGGAVRSVLYHGRKFFTIAGK